MHREPLPLIATGDLDPKEHGAIETAVEMTLVHNCFIRAINSICKFCLLVTVEEHDTSPIIAGCGT